jgi:hypothetical protein
MANKFFLIILIIISGKISNAKEYPLDSIKQNWIPFFSFSFLNSRNEDGTFIRNNPYEIGGYKVIPVHEFSIERKRNVSYLTKPEYSVSSGLQYPIVKNGILGTEIKFSQIVNPVNIKRIRYSDMVDETKGFVNPTNLKDIKINYAYRVLSFSLSYQIEQKIGKHFTHRMGYKCQYDRLINSVYEIAAIKDNQKIYYFNKDLKWYDKYWSISHFYNYEIKLYHNKNQTFWLNTQYGFVNPYISKDIRKDKSYSESNFHLLSIGIKFEI